MSESYTTLGQGTLASNYTAASGTMTFNSGHSFPSSPTFSIAFTVNSVVVVIYTVTGVGGGGNIFSVTVEWGTDQNWGSTTLGVEVLTARSLNQIRQDLIGKQTHQFMAASNQAGVASSNFNYASGQVPNPTVFTGSNVLAGYIPFTKATGLTLQFNLSLTKDFVPSSIITVDAVWMCAGGSGNVVWTLTPSYVAPASSIDSAFGTAVSVTAAVTASANLLIYTTFPNLTGPASDSNQAYFQLTRAIGNVSDTATIDARLLYLVVTFHRYINQN